MTRSLLIAAALLILGFPLLTLALGEVKSRLRRQGNPLEHFVNNLQRFVLPPLAILLILQQLLKLNELGLALQLLEMALWLGVGYTALSLLKVILVTEEKQYDWQTVIPNLFFQVGRAAIFLVVGAFILGRVWQVDLSQVAAALGVGSLVVALALQDTLSNLVSGFLLLLEGPLKKEDWLKVGDSEGKVIEMNWRAVRLQTIEGNVVIIPNGTLGKQTILNYNLPNAARGIWIEIGFSYNDPPNKVKKILRQVLTELKGVDLDKGFKIVSTGNYDDFFINYRVMFMAADYISAFKARNDFRTRLYYVAKRHGLNIPFPISHIYHTDLEQNTVEDSPEAIVDYLQSLPYFDGVEAEALEKLALNAEVDHYGMGEQVLWQDKLAPGLYIIQRGSAALTFKDAQGAKQAVGEASQGDFFGESVLMSGKTSALSVVAANDLKVIRLEPAATANLVAERPLFAKQIDELIDERRKVIRRLREKEKVELTENTMGNGLLNSSSALQTSSK